MLNYSLIAILLLIILFLLFLLFKTKKQLKKANEKQSQFELQLKEAQLEAVERNETITKYRLQLLELANEVSSKNEKHSTFNENTLASLQEYPYKATHLLTRTEYSFYQILKTECDNKNLLICPKVRMEDFLEITYQDQKKLFKYRNHIKSRHIDFLICNKNLYLLAGIELDDISHINPTAKVSDNFKDNVFKAIGLPLYRIPVSNQNNYRIQMQKIFLELL